MKTNKPLFTIALIIMLTVTFQISIAKIWRVNNQSNYNTTTTLWGDNFGGTISFPVFKQISDGMAQFANGDTVHLEGTTGIYNSITLNKKLTIIGPGYFLPENPKTSTNALDAKISAVYFSAGSADSKIMGLNLVGVGTGGYVFINTNGITVTRCRIENKIELGSGISDVFITQNFFSETANQNVFAAVSGNYIAPIGITFDNNICKKTLVWRSIGGAAYPIEECNNNIFDGPDNLTSSTLEFIASDFKNNILMAANAVVNITASPAIIQYNIGTLNSQFGLTNNNIVIPTAQLATLFTGGISTDGYYRLATGSAAQGAGFIGVDIGAFGNATVGRRYTLSGLAGIPVIYGIATTGVASTSQGMSVNIQARTVKP